MDQLNMIKALLSSLGFFSDAWTYGF
jgi:hypothetical protein